MSVEEDRQRELSDRILEFARRMEKPRREHTGSELDRDEKSRWGYTERVGRSFGDEFPVRRLLVSDLFAEVLRLHCELARARRQAEIQQRVAWIAEHRLSEHRAIEAGQQTAAAWHHNKILGHGDVIALLRAREAKGD